VISTQSAVILAIAFGVLGLVALIAGILLVGRRRDEEDERGEPD
jgi:hypothetical protein